MNLSDIWRYFWKNFGSGAEKAMGSTSTNGRTAAISGCCRTSFLGAGAENSAYFGIFDANFEN